MVGLLVCLLVGVIKGPDVFEKSGRDIVETQSLNVTWYGKIDGMERWHQVGIECCLYHVVPCSNWELCG